MELGKGFLALMCRLGLCRHGESVYVQNEVINGVQRYIYRCKRSGVYYSSLVGPDMEYTFYGLRFLEDGRLSLQLFKKHEVVGEEYSVSEFFDIMNEKRFVLDNGQLLAIVNLMESTCMQLTEKNKSLFAEKMNISRELVNFKLGRISK